MSDPLVTTAKYSGICPFCHVYIAKNVSPVIRLPYGVVPRGNGRKSYDTDRYYRGDGRPIHAPSKPRRYVHERCYQVFLQGDRKASDQH